MGSVTNLAAKAAGKISGVSDAYNAAKGIVHGLESLVGLGGPTEAQRRHKAYVGYHNIIRSGDFDAMWAGAQKAKYAGGKWELLWAYYNRVPDANLAEAARRLANVSRDPRSDEAAKYGIIFPTGPGAVPTSGGGLSSPSPVPTPPVGTASPTAPSPQPSASPATPAPPKPKICKYGLDPATGRCLTKAQAASLASQGSSTPAGFVGSTKKVHQCKYGRDPITGLCNKRPSSGYGSGSSAGRTKMTAAEKRANKVQAAAMRRAEAAVVGGLTSAGKAAVKAAGGVIPAALLLGQVAAIGAAGYVAYRITAKLLTLRYKTWDELLNDVANEYRHQRQQLAGMTATQEGRPLTQEELDSAALWYKGATARLKALRANGTPISDVSSVIFSED